MSNSVGWATLDVIPSMKGLRSELERQVPEFTRVGRAGGERLGNAAAEGFRARFAGRVQGDLSTMIAPAVATAGIVAGFRQLYDEASSAQQSIGGVQAVFAEYAGAVISDSDRAATAVGLSANAYRELITASGAMLKNKGLTDYADQATSLIRIGADLAAQFGGPTSQAVDALTAAMRGESDPIERYGVSLNETAVKAKAAEMGLGSLEGASGELAKTQARLQIIAEQTADAQGAFARESGTAANEAQKLKAEWADLSAEWGARSLPMLTQLTEFAREDALPALDSGVGIVANLATAFGDLPDPVKATAGAFAAMKAASALGILDGMQGGAERAGRGVETLRREATRMSDEYRALRTVSRDVAGSAVLVSSGVSRTEAALRAATPQAKAFAGGLKSSLGGLVGGPWGVALMGGTVLLSEFLNKQAEARNMVDQLAASLDGQTGALTEVSRATAVGILQNEDFYDGKTLERAREAGLDLEKVVDAALGNSAALKTLREEAVWAMPSQDLDPFLDALADTDGMLGQAKTSARDARDALGETATATDTAATATEGYAGRLSEARDALQQLADAESKRAGGALAAMRDRIALEEGKRELDRGFDKDGELTRGAGVDLSTVAGTNNLQALVEFADTWNNAEKSVRNSKGTYADIRREFLDTARQMEVPKARMKELADELLSVPKTAPIEFQTKGFRKAVREIETIRGLLGTGDDWFPTMRPGLPDVPRPVDPPTTGPGVGPVAPGVQVGSQINIYGDVRANDSREFKQDMTRRQRAGALGGRPW